MGVERKAARKLRTQGGQSAASVNKSWAKHRLRCANAAHAAQPTAAARRPGPRSLAGDIRQASGSARSSHAMRFYHLPLGSWLMLSLHQAGAKGRGRMCGGHCARGYASTAMCGAAYRVRKSVAQMCACLPIVIAPLPLPLLRCGKRQTGKERKKKA